MAPRKAVRYKDAGVDIDEGDRAVDHIKHLAHATFTRGVVTDIGAFGAGFELTGWKKPVLVSSADGVGTKLKIAFATGRHDTVGQDLVNHCVNDIGVLGARPSSSSITTPPANSMRKSRARLSPDCPAPAAKTAAL